MLQTYKLKNFSEQLNVLKVDDDGINTIENFECTTTDISLKNHHTWGCPVYVLDARLQENISVITKQETRLRAGIYPSKSTFHAGPVALVLNPETGHVSNKFHVVFDDGFSTVPFMR